MLILYLKISCGISQIWCYQIHLVLPKSPQFSDDYGPAELVRHSLLTGLPTWYSTHHIQAGWINKKPIANILIDLILNPTYVYGLAGVIKNPLLTDWPTWYSTHLVWCSSPSHHQFGTVAVLHSHTPNCQVDAFICQMTIFAVRTVGQYLLLVNRSHLKRFQTHPHPV